MSDQAVERLVADPQRDVPVEVHPDLRLMRFIRGLPRKRRRREWPAGRRPRPGASLQDARRMIATVAMVSASVWSCVT